MFPGHVESTFVNPTETFSLKVQKTWNFSIFLIKKIFFLAKIIPRTRRTYFWKPCRKHIAQSPIFSLKFRKIVSYRRQFWKPCWRFLAQAPKSRYFFSVSSLRKLSVGQIECIFDNLVEIYLLRVQNFLLEVLKIHKISRSFESFSAQIILSDT